MRTGWSSKAARSPHAATQTLRLDPPAPFRLALTAWALRRRPQNAIDVWDGRQLSPRSAHRGADGGRGGRTDRPAGHAEARGDRNRPVSGASGGVGRDGAGHKALGVEVDLSGFYTRAAGDPVLGPLVRRNRSLKPPRFPTLFECLLNAVACQQLSIAAGLTLLGRLAHAAAPADATLHPFPAPDEVLRLPPAALRNIGFSVHKVDAIRDLADAAAAGQLELDRFEDGMTRRSLRRSSSGPGLAAGARTTCCCAAWAASTCPPRGHRCAGRAAALPRLRGRRRRSRTRARALETRGGDALLPPARARPGGARCVERGTAVAAGHYLRKDRPIRMIPRVDDRPTR